MRKEDLYRAIGELDEKILHKSETGWKPSRVFRTALTAAACLLLAVGIGSAVWLSRGGAPETWETTNPGAADHTVQSAEDGIDWNLCDMILEEDSLYFTTINMNTESGETIDARVFCYDPRENSTVRLDDFPAAFTRAQSGNYCTDRSTGDVYALGGGSLTKVGSIPEYDEQTHELLGVTDDTLLYSVEVFRDGYFFDIYELNLTDQTTRTIYSNNDSDVLLTASYLRDGVFYYERSVVMGETGYYAMDIQTGESEQLNIVPPSGKELRYLTFFDDAIYLLAYPEDVVDPTAHDAEDVELCKVDYDTLELTSLTQTGLGFDIQRDGQKLYWELPTYNDDGSLTVRRIYEYDLEAASVTRTIDLPASKSQSVYCADGCYYNDNREDQPGIFFYNAAIGETVRIDPAEKAVQAEQAAPGSGEIVWNEYDTLLSGDCLYFSMYNYAPERGELTDPGVFLYDPTTDGTLQLGELPMEFTRAQSGNYCTDVSTGDIYELEGHSMTHVGALPVSEERPELTLIDVQGDSVYCYNPVALYVLDTQRGNVRELYRVEDGSYTIQGAYFRDWVLYYWTVHQTADPEIFALDLNTGERRKLEFTFAEGSLWRFGEIAFYEDGIFTVAGFYDDTGYRHYWLDYDTQEAQLLATPEIDEYAIGPVSRDGDTLYWKHWHPEQEERYQVAAYDLNTDTIQNWDMELPKPTDQLRVYDGGCYYASDSQGTLGIFRFDLSTGETTRIDPGTQSDAGTVSAKEAAAEPSEDTFFALFHELDETSMRAYLDTHPEVLNHGWGGVDINASGLEDAGTSIQTKNGDQVLAVNAKDGVLLIRVEVENARGVLAIGKDTAQLRLCPAETLGTEGQTVGTICENNGGVLAITGSAFIDPNGSGNGGTLSGLMVSGGETYGTALGGDYKRLELREDDRMYVVDSDSAVADGTRDAVEFQPAAIVDGEIVVGEEWNGFNPRALIGQSERLETMMLVMEGRFADSVGCGVEDCAKILKEYGCAQALNLDGGTSAIMYYQGKCVTRCSNTDLPDGRPLPSAWVYGKAE